MRSDGEELVIGVQEPNLPVEARGLKLLTVGPYRRVAISVLFGDVVRHQVMKRHHNRGCPSGGSREEGRESVNGEASVGKHHGMLTVLLVDDHRLVLDSLRRHAEEDGAERKKGVHRHRGPVERAAVEAERSCGWVHHPIAVDEAQHTEDPKGLVDVVLIFPGGKLPDVPHPVLVEEEGKGVEDVEINHRNGL
eukprot:CAMPEP_0114529944 /NCGR_PEP_ID=MMETSP0109-20121206/25144_1 /TAXON_ID=29199 /ORGANISM="Chlorarachnion reptans, Strain CCCM449" /LENGTH=192 /DNA_ID=CAMNT_0001712459 /DNA_START=479 /DNA_END=1060 /DNA_ORIENTATION=-